MRIRIRVLALSCASLALAVGSGALAQPPAQRAEAAEASAPPKGDEEKAEQSRRHFKNGVKLFSDQNYTGALAEFEAAYALGPGAGALQNIALCLKELYRYAEAADQLEKLLELHPDELSEEDRKAVGEAIDELSALVGTIRLEVSPPNARVSVDDRALTRKQRTEGVRLNVGEHNVAAQAPGYAPLHRVIRVAGGQQVIEKLSLKPTAGFISVETSDPDAAIAIDGKALAFEKWQGPVAPGRRLVQVYKEGFRPFERLVEVKLGETARVKARLGPPEADAPEGQTLAGSGQEPKAKQQRGWYALGTLTVFGLTQLPEGLSRHGDERAGGVAGGARAGFRVWTPLAAEAMLEGGRHEVPDTQLDEEHCQPSQDDDCLRKYTVDSFRLGGNLRLMSGGEKLRFTSCVGSGAVHRQLRLEDSGNAFGLDPYFLLEIGAQLNLGHVLLELGGVASVEGTAGTTGNLLGQQSGDPAGEVYRKAGGGLWLLGLGLRGGWSEWAPPRSAELLQPAGRR